MSSCVICVVIAREIFLQKAVAERKPENWDWNPDLCDTGVALGGKP